MATATAAAPMAISQNLLLTLPPPTRSDFRGRTGGEYPLLLTDFQATRFRFGSGSPAPLTMQSGRSGGTGRRAGLKIRFPPGSVGSIPTFGTFVSRTRGVPRLASSQGWGNAEGNATLPFGPASLDSQPVAAKRQ